VSLPREKFRERLGYYLMGVAIGCMVLGFAWMARKQAAQRAQQQQQQQQSPPAR
jgi:hypothetical protein